MFRNGSVFIHHSFAQLQHLSMSTAVLRHSLLVSAQLLAFVVQAARARECPEHQRARDRHAR